MRIFALLSAFLLLTVYSVGGVGVEDGILPVSNISQSGGSYNPTSPYGFDDFYTDGVYSAPAALTVVGNYALGYHGDMTFPWAHRRYVSATWNTWRNLVDGESAGAGAKPAELANNWMSGGQVVTVRTFRGENETTSQHVARHKEYVEEMQEAFPPDTQ